MKIATNFFLKAQNFRSFGEEPQGLDAVLPINVVIGKNNSGKSALLQLVDFATRLNTEYESKGHKGTLPKFLLKRNISKESVEKIFSSSTSGGGIPGNHAVYGARLIDREIIFEIKSGNQRAFSAKNNPGLMEDLSEAERTARGDNLAKQANNPFSGKTFRLLSAERDIWKEKLEPISKEQNVLDSNGRGATNLAANFVNSNLLPESKFENELLDALKEIYGNDSDFTRIQVQMNPDTSEYEIFLQERNKGDRIALSESGSSLKTILLVLLNVILIPEFYKKGLNNFIFAFEELENNLHPSLQRRLLQYLMKLARESECTFFLTTHSNIFIDVFSKQDDAQLLHVKHNGESAIVEKVATHLQKNHIIDDLDFRASDVLQANGVIWVEGPSDRIYLKKLISLWSNDALQEDIHYQFVFYGGSVRKHLSASNPEEVESAISVFRINRNAVVVMDSDRTKKGQKLDTSKQRLIDEINKIPNSETFVTYGRDFENYLSPLIIKEHLKLKLEPRQIERFEDFKDYLNELSKGKGNTFEKNKVLFAEKVKDNITKENISGCFDMNKQINNLVLLIKRWNKLD